MSVSGEDATRRLSEDRDEVASEDRNIDAFVSAWGSKVHNALFIVVASCLIMTIVEIGNQNTVAAQTAITEQTVCNKYYGSSRSRSGSSEAVIGFGAERCKFEPIQSELALIIGWKNALDTIPGIVFAIPYGILADRVGRKKVIVLALIGLFLSDCWVRVVLWFSDIFPTRAIWLSGLWQIVGGGATTFESVRSAMIADVCPEDKRLTAFLWIQAARLISDLVAAPLGAALMSINAWYPMWTASGTMVVGIILTVLLIPETFIPESAEQKPNEVGERSRLLTPDEEEDYEPVLSHQHREPVGRVSEGILWMTHSIGVVSIIFTFFLILLGRQTTEFLLQYASKRFHWSYARASFLLSLQAAVNLVVVLVLFPALSTLLSRRLNLDAATKDKLLTQVSGVCLVLGSFTIFIGATPALLILGLAVFALGLAFTVTARSFVTAMIDQRHLGIIYTAISVMTYAGIVVGGPLLAATFKWGMMLSEFWLGLPYLVASGVFLLALLLVSTAGVKSLAV
ncbi:MFS multidrug transporter [Pleurostoma richardsiae]|uniref:MFS multidrug transporter n=1 Tax=Pleurostoma richardsiae TaxID=41990 RepID=A0AA38S0C6_9PEZI|nr:MFS multidrug transporter [Pleurostoma richardsiae]